MIGLLFALAGIMLMSDDDDLTESVLWPLAMFWPASVIGLLFFVLLKSSNVLAADAAGRKAKREKTNRRAAPKPLR